MGKEVLTLQFGPYSHGVAAHFWNLQNELLSPDYAAAGGDAAEVDHAVLLHATPGGAVHPRTLVFDARDSRGLQLAAARAPPSVLHAHAKAAPGGAQERGAADGLSWGDFLQAELAPRSLVPLGGRGGASVRCGGV
jgi:hypothetical protein